MNDHSPAYLDGWFAHREGADIKENPYDEKTQPYSSIQWDSGWTGRFGAIKHGHDLSLDDKLFD